MIDIEIIDPSEVEQGTEDWFKLRMGRITSSNFPLLMQKPKSGDFNNTQLTYLKERAVEILTGIRPESFTNKYMEWGTETEPLAREYYELETFSLVKEVGFYPFGENFGDSPDGIIEGVRALEFKCPKSTTHLDYLLDPSKLVKAYNWQCYGHMIATGLKECDLVSFDPRFTDNSKKMVMVNIKLEQEKADELMSRLFVCNEKLTELVNA